MVEFVHRHWNPPSVFTQVPSKQGSVMEDINHWNIPKLRSNQQHTLTVYTLISVFIAVGSNIATSASTHVAIVVCVANGADPTILAGVGQTRIFFADVVSQQVCDSGIQISGSLQNSL